MKKVKLLLVLLIVFSGNLLYAQEETAEYKKYENLAKKINNIQRTANEKKFSTDDEVTILKIPEQNFIFNYYDFTVSNIIRVANEKGEASIIYENIDLANIEDIGILDESFRDCGVVILTPNKMQNYKIVIDDEVHSRESESIVFYFLNSERTKGKEMFDALVDLVLQAKIKKASYTDLQAKTLVETWKETEKKNTAESYYKFWNDLPDNLFRQMAYYRLEKLDKSFNIDKINLSGYQLGMTKAEFEKVFYKKLKSFTTTDPLAQEAIKNYNISYSSNPDKNEYSTMLYFAEANTDIANRKLKKNEEIPRLMKEQKTLFAKDILPELTSFKLNLEHVIFDATTNELKELCVILPLSNNGDNSKEIILASAINHFGSIKSKNDANDYFSFRGYGSSKLSIHFFSNEAWIILSTR